MRETDLQLTVESDDAGSASPQAQMLERISGKMSMYSGRSLWLKRRAVSQFVAIAVLVSGLSVPAAATTGGHGALALAAIVGQYDPALTSGVRGGLLRLLADEAFGTQSGKLIVKADAVTCRAGDVDLKAFGCTLTFGTRTVTLKGRQAAEIYATLIESGVPSDGTAVTLFESLKALSCTLDLTELGGPGMGDGGGASCDYQAGP